MMNAHAQTIDAEPTTIVVLAEPSKALTVEGVFARLEAELELEIAAHIPDLTTKKGRDAVRALAARITRFKTAVDDAGLKLTADMRHQIAEINSARSMVKDALDALATKARKPLTDWEAAEDLKKRRIDALNADIVRLSTASIGDTSDIIAGRIVELQDLDLSAEVFGDDLPIMTAKRQRALDALAVDMNRELAAERDRAELAKLRAEAAARAEADRIKAETEALAKAEADRLAAEAAAQAERVRIEAERAAKAKADEEARIAAAAEKARLDAIEAEQAKARAEQAERDRQAAAALAMAEAEKAALQRQIDEATAAAAAAQAKADADAKAAAADTARRERDLAHRDAVVRAAAFAMRDACDVPVDIALDIVRAIVAGKIPAVSVNF